SNLQLQALHHGRPGISVDERGAQGDVRLRHHRAGPGPVAGPAVGPPARPSGPAPARRDGARGIGRLLAVRGALRPPRAAPPGASPGAGRRLAVLTAHRRPRPAPRRARGPAPAPGPAPHDARLSTSDGARLPRAAVSPRSPSKVVRGSPS